MTCPALITRRSGRFGANPPLGLVGVHARDEDGVTRADRRLAALAEGVARGIPNRAPALVRIGGVERQLARAARHRVAVHRHPGRVGATARHLDEHRREVLAEALLDLG